MPLKNELKGVRLDSGDLAALSKKVRAVLDKEGLHSVKILASGNLNEHKIEDLIRAKAPIDLFGVGTEMVTSRDYPALDLTYKLVQTVDGKGTVKFRAKRSPHKQTIPGKKQVFRRFDKNGLIREDRIGLAAEKAPEKMRPLLHPVITQGQLIGELPSVADIRKNARAGTRALPARFWDLNKRSCLKPKYTERISKLIN